MFVEIDGPDPLEVGLVSVRILDDDGKVAVFVDTALQIIVEESFGIAVKSSQISVFSCHYQAVVVPKTLTTDDTLLVRTCLRYA